MSEPKDRGETGGNVLVRLWRMVSRPAVRISLIEDASPHPTVLGQDLMKVVHHASPYEGFEASAYPLDMQGWLKGKGVLDQIIDHLKPQIIIEVGTWKGASAFYMIERARRHQPDAISPDAVIVCVDTWLGSPEHYLTPLWRTQLNLKHGRARVYQQFLANVIHQGLTDCVIPLSMPSVQAAQLLEQLGIRAAMIHIDAAHDAGSVRQDIEAYWPLLVPEGVMVGDDYNPKWPGVIAAADAFLKSAPDIETSGAGDKRWFAQKKAVAA